MTVNKPLPGSRWIGFCVALLLVLGVNGAMPFLASPTLGQAIWTMGFAQSFANGSLAALHAHEFGVPQAAAIAFGLAGAWPASLLLRLGLSPADAYSTMVALWLTLAFVSASRIGQLFGASRPVAILGAVLWGTMPAIWAHAGYSMMSIGIALLPFYFLAVLRLLGLTGGRFSFNALNYLLATVIAVFMDGYSFMMFAVGSSLLMAFAWLQAIQARGLMLIRTLPVHLLSFALAYVLYVRYVGTNGFERAPLDFFRAWGVDLAFITVPSEGVLWIADRLGLSVERTASEFYGDASTWMTTFALPLLVVCGALWAKERSKPRLATGVLLVAIVGFYLALGPSLKIQSTKPPEVSKYDVMMPEDRAIMPTGSAWISEKLPGFNAMRAAYRWSALGIFAAWLLLMLFVPMLRGRWGSMLLLSGLILFNLPHPLRHWQQSQDNRTAFWQIDSQLVAVLKGQLLPGEQVAFVPWGNDFFANYLAPRLGIRTFNVGGDKGLIEAQRTWPAAMLAAGPSISVDSLAPTSRLLVDGNVDVLVIPYFNMLWSAHVWPCIELTVMRLSEQQKRSLQDIPGFICPQQRHEELAMVLAGFANSPYLEVIDGPWFATVRLNHEFRGQDGRRRLRERGLAELSYPFEFRGSSLQAPLMLIKGWHSIEPGQVWSKEEASLELPMPARCSSIRCDIWLELAAFGASEQRPVQVKVSTHCHSEVRDNLVEFLSSERRQISIPSCPQESVQNLVLSVPKAISPQLLTGSPDPRVLGVSLTKVDIR